MSGAKAIVAKLWNSYTILRDEPLPDGLPWSSKQVAWSVLDQHRACGVDDFQVAE